MLGGNENKRTKKSSQNAWCTDQNSNAALSEHKYATLNLHGRVNKIGNNETQNPSFFNCSHLWLIEPVSSSRNGISRLFLL
jgi:hypothetical protein